MPDASLSPSGLPTVDARWGGLAAGGSYLLVGRANAGRTALALAATKVTVDGGGRALLISPRSPDDLAAAGAPSGVDLRALHVTGRLRLLRIPAPADLAARGSDGLDAAYRDLAALVETETPDRVVIEDVTPLVQFDSFERLQTALSSLIATLRDAGITLLMGLGEPANAASEHLIEVVRTLVDGTLTLSTDGETRRLDLARHDDPLSADTAPEPEHVAPEHATSESPQDATPDATAPTVPDKPAPPPVEQRAAEPSDTHIRRREDDLGTEPDGLPRTRIIPPPTADPSLTEPPPDTFDKDPAASMFEQGYLVDSGAGSVVGAITPTPAASAPASPPQPTASPAIAAPPAAPAFAPLGAPGAAPDPETAVRAALDAAFAARAAGTPFLVVAVRMEAAAPESAHFFAVADGLRRGLRPVDRLLVDLPRRRAVVVLPGVGAEGAAALFASLQAHLRSTLGADAEAVLRAVGAVSVPNGEPFTSTQDLMAYAFES